MTGIVVLRGLLLGLLLAKAAAGLCRGLASYELRIEMKWTRAIDADFDRSMAVGGVVSVAHNEDFDLFTPDEDLSADLRHLMRTNKIGPTLKRLDLLQADSQKRVRSFDYVTGAGASDTITLNLELDGATGATLVSFMGVLLGTPDFFFGYRNINMCVPTEVNGRQVLNFTQRFPPPGKQAWVLPYDAGYDARVKITPGSTVVPQNKGVHRDNRPALAPVTTYAIFTIAPPSHDGQPGFWRWLSQLWLRLRSYV